MNRVLIILAVALSISFAAIAQFYPYTTVTVDTRKNNKQFYVKEEHYANTPFFKFIINENGSAADLSGWDFALKYGYDRNADVMYSLSGTNYVTVTNNEVLINGTTNYFFEARRGYYVALQGTYTSGGDSYEHTFAEGRMDVVYTPAADGDVQNLVNGLLTYTHIPTGAIIRINNNNYTYSNGKWDLGVIYSGGWSATNSLWLVDENGDYIADGNVTNDAVWDVDGNGDYYLNP